MLSFDGMNMILLYCTNLHRAPLSLALWSKVKSTRSLAGRLREEAASSVELESKKKVRTKMMIVNPTAAIAQSLFAHFVNQNKARSL